MYKQLLGCTFVALTFIFYSGAFAQNSSISGINLGVKVGAAKLLGESPKGSAGFINEFDNEFGIASGFEISKYLSPHWEIAAEFSYSILKGGTDNPQLSAEGNHPVVPAGLEEPVEYKNKLSGFNFLSRYYFKPVDSESAFVPFVLLGAGYIKYNSIFKYKDAPEDDVIFSKGKDSWTLSTPGFYIGTGFNSFLSSNLYLKTSIDFKFVNYGFLDVVHNYSENGIKQEVLGLFTELKVGLFFSIKGNGKKKTSRSKYGNSIGTSFLPFSR